jgi:dihydrolipoamide dehydrogenase
VELSMLFAKLGVEVTVIEALDSMMLAFPSNLVVSVVSTASELGMETNYDSPLDVNPPLRVLQ